MRGFSRTLSARLAVAAAAAVCFAAILAPPAATAGLFSNVVEELTSTLPPGVTKVPVYGPGNSYEDGLSAAQKRQVVTFGKLADSAYGGEPPPAGYTRLSASEAAALAGQGFSVQADGTVTLPGLAGASGFNAMFFKDASGKIVLGFRGTEGLTAPGDLWTDAAQAIGTDGKPTAQYQAAADLLRNVLANTPGEVVVTGHSLGGGLANFAMAANDLQGRVTGYTFNAAGLSDNTFEYLQKVHPGGTANASDATINLRNKGDPVSYIDGHVGVMYEVDNPDGVLAAHGIGCLVGNLETTQDVDGTRQGRASMSYQDPFEQAAGALANGLSAVMPAGQAQLVAVFVAEYARYAALLGAEKLDEKISAELTRLEKRLQGLVPGDASSRALSETFAALKKGDLQAAGRGLLDIGTGAAEDAVREGLAKAGITGQDADAIVQGAKDAIKTAIDGGDVGGSVLGSVEGYVYDKVKDSIGQEAADAWKNVYEDVKAGADPWTDLKDAAVKTATVKFDEFVDRTAKAVQARLDEMLKNHPVLADMFQALGISGRGFSDAAKWTWGVLTGPGSLAEKLETIANGGAAAFKDMVDRLGRWALDKAKQYANALLSGAARKIVAAVNKVIAKVNGLIGKVNAAISEINGYAEKIKKFANLVAKISKDAKMILVDIGAGETSAPVRGADAAGLGADIIDHYTDQQIPTLDYVPSVSIPAIH